MALTSVQLMSVAFEEQFLSSCKLNTCKEAQVRMLQGVDLATLKLQKANGKAAGIEYRVGKNIPKLTLDDNDKRGLVPYAANCHCGAVTYTINFPSLFSGENEVRRCNCSICTRDGYLLVYPNRTDVIFHTGLDHLRSYLFGSRTAPHKFFPACGSSVLIDPIGKNSLDFLCMNVCIVKVNAALMETSC